MSGYVGPGTLDVSFIAGAALRTTTSQYRPVYISASKTVNLATATTDKVIGVNMSYLSASSEACTVRLFGVGKAICVASVTAGEMVAPNAAGTISEVSTVTAVLTTTAWTGIVGRALETGITNQAISIFINPEVKRG